MADIQTFAVLPGQLDNIGDSLLRRALLRQVGTSTTRHIYVGEDSDDYTSNLGLRSDDRVYAHRSEWMRSLTHAAMKGRTNLLFNAGETALDRRFIKGRLLNLPAMAALKVRNGCVVQAGVGLRGATGGSSIGRRLASSCDLLSWRDDVSRTVVGSGSVCPDWAFAEGAPLDEIGTRHRELDSSDRTVAITVRGDRELPSADWVSAVRSLCTRINAHPVVVCQVRRDMEACSQLASALGAELVGWPAQASHGEHEAVVRGVYSRSQWIVSNRLHALIMAMTEGAVVLPYLPDEGAKLVRTLLPGGFTYNHGLPPSIGATPMDSLQDDRTTLRVSLQAARDAIDALSARINHYLEHGGRDPR